MPDVMAKIRSLAAAVEAVDATLSVADRLKLNDELFGLQKDVMSLQIANDELARENAKLRDKLSRRKRMEYIDGSYYIVEGETRIGPICPRCYRDDDVINHLHGGRCSVCGTVYTAKDEPYVPKLY